MNVMEKQNHGLLKGVDPYDEKASIQQLFGDDCKGRVLQEAIWNTYQAWSLIISPIGLIHT